MRSTDIVNQEGAQTNYNVSLERIAQLEEIGLQWQVINYDESFEKRCRELIVLKEDFGHVNVVFSYPRNPSLGLWCKRVRATYQTNQRGMCHLIISRKNRIARLEEIDLQWQGVDYDKAFENRCRDLIVFKEEFGHSSVPVKYSGNPSLGKWCSTMRFSIYIQNKPEENESRLQSFTRHDKSTGGEWLPMAEA